MLVCMSSVSVTGIVSVVCVDVVMTAADLSVDGLLVVGVFRMSCEVSESTNVGVVGPGRAVLGLLPGNDDCTVPVFGSVGIAVSVVV